MVVAEESPPPDDVPPAVRLDKPAPDVTAMPDAPPAATTAWQLPYTPAPFFAAPQDIAAPQAAVPPPPMIAPSTATPPAARSTKSRAPVLLAIALAVIAVACLAAAIGIFALRDSDATALTSQQTGASRSPMASATPTPERTPRPQRTRRTDAVPTQTVTVAPTVTVLPPPVLPSVPPVATPYWTVIVSSKTESEGGLAAAQEVAAQLQGGGYEYDIFLSDAYSSLRPGYWVTATGRFSDADSAALFQGTVRATTDFDDAYTKCVGTAAQCG